MSLFVNLLPAAFNNDEIGLLRCLPRLRMVRSQLLKKKPRLRVFLRACS